MDEDAVLAMNGAQLCQMAIEKNIPVRLGKVLKQVSGCLPGRTMDDLDNIPNEYNRLKHKKWMVPLDNRHLYEDRLLRVLSEALSQLAPSTLQCRRSACPERNGPYNYASSCRK